MDTLRGLFEVERLGDILVLTPQRNLRELEFREIERKGKEVSELASDPSVRGVVVDFGRTDFFGSSALGLLLRLWRQVSGRGGPLALCNVSDHETEVLGVTGLAGLWPVYATREEACAAVGAPVQAA
jgi:stage II sporulation protein AA (anti-sigma F factor antagonist)